MENHVALLWVGDVSVGKDPSHASSAAKLRPCPSSTGDLEALQVIEREWKRVDASITAIITQRDETLMTELNGYSFTSSAQLVSVMVETSLEFENSFNGSIFLASMTTSSEEKNAKRSS
eukprot:scaffold16207_cov547-Ochromonas_danica.AAC.1